MSIYNFKPESVYNFTDMSQEEFTDARREYDYYLQSVLDRPINIDLNKERETVAQELENENLAALDKTFEDSIAANPMILKASVYAYQGALEETKVDKNLSLEEAATGRFVADALINNPRLFNQWQEGGYNLEKNNDTTINMLYIDQALSDYIGLKQNKLTAADHTNFLVEDIVTGGISRGTAERRVAESITGKSTTFNTDLREEELRRYIYNNAKTMKPKEFKKWFDSTVVKNIDNLDSIYIRGLSVLSTADLDEGTDLFKLDMARRLMVGSTAGDQAMPGYGNIETSEKALKTAADLITSPLIKKQNKTLKLKKLVNDDEGATQIAEELSRAGDNAVTAHESNYSATIGTGAAMIPSIIDRPRVLEKEVTHPLDVTPYDYRFYEKDYMDNYMYDNENVINMYRDDQGIWTTDLPDTTIYQGQDKFTQIPYTDDAVAFTENPAPGYTRVVYGTGSDGKQAFSSYGEAERAAYDMTIETAERDGYIVVDAASYKDYKKPSFKAIGTGEGNNAYAEGPALYYSVREKDNSWLAARDHYYKMFKDVRMDDKIYERITSKFTYDSYKDIYIDILERTFNKLRFQYSYIYQQNKGNIKKASKEFMNQYFKAKDYYTTHLDDTDDLLIDFGLDREIFEKLPEPLVDRKTGVAYDNFADAIIDTSFEEILNTPHPVIKTFIIPKKYYKGLIDEINWNNDEIIKAFNKRYAKDYGENPWQIIEGQLNKKLTYSDIYRFVEDDVRINIGKELRKSDILFTRDNFEKVATAYFNKPYRDVLKSRTLKELHKLGIYGSKHAKTNIAINTNRVQKNVATTTSTGLDGIITDMYTIENSKYWYTPVNINGRWYIQNTIRWNDKPIKMYKDGTIMEL